MHALHIHYTPLKEGLFFNWWKLETSVEALRILRWIKTIELVTITDTSVYRYLPISNVV